MRERRLMKGPDWILRETLKGEPELIIIDECRCRRSSGGDLLSSMSTFWSSASPDTLPPVKGAGAGFSLREPDAM